MLRCGRPAVAKSGRQFVQRASGSSKSARASKRRIE